jgi:MFS family permease
VIVIAHAVLIQVITFALRPGLAYAVLDSSDVAALLGVLSAGFAIPALLLALPSGQFVDRLGERVAAILGSVLVVAAAAVALLSRGNFLLVLLATVLLGCGHLLSVVSEQTLVANQAKSGRLDATFGRYTLAASAGQVLGPLLLAIPGENAATPPLEILFSICIALALLLVVASILIHRTPASGIVAQGGMFRSAGSLLATTGVPRALIASSIALSTVDITLLYWPALGQERGLEVAVISAMLFTRSACTMASRGALGFASRFAGRKVLMAGSLSALPQERCRSRTSVLLYRRDCSDFSSGCANR